MNYEEARAYVRQAETKGSILGLENIKRLMEELGNVQDKLNVLHIAGTNGKGSTLAYISEILKQAGYKVGKYTSPAVFDYLELFMINNEKIEEKCYAENMSIIEQAVTRIVAAGYEPPTGFEIETALAYLYFYREKCDIVLIETGMGGDMDATNVVNNTLLSIITPISPDHMQFLGDTIREISIHKAGIIKKNSAVISSIQEKDAEDEIKKAAKKKGAMYIQAGMPKNIVYEENKTIFEYVSADNTRFERLETSMLGTFQPCNVCVAVEAVLYLKKKGFIISNDIIRAGIYSALWHGRFEKLGESPRIYLDGGHNPGAAVHIKKSIEIYFTNRKIIYIIGVLADKNYDSVLKQTAEPADEIITVTPNNKRALSGEVLRDTAKKYNQNVSSVPSIEMAVDKAIQHAGETGVIMIFGSLSFLKEVREYYTESIDRKTHRQGNE